MDYFFIKTDSFGVSLSQARQDALAFRSSQGPIKISMVLSRRCVFCDFPGEIPFRFRGLRGLLMAVRVLIADDHEMFRQGLRVLLEEEGFQFVAEASNGRQAVDLCQQHHPEVAILDVAMPVLNGIYAAREIIKANPRTKVVLLTQHTEDQMVLESLRAGVTGYVLKTKATSELVQALRAVCRGEMYLTQSISRTVVQAFLMKDALPERPLSDRERQVLQLVAEGKTTKEIASLLGISVNTAESHRTNLMEKLDIHDTAGLVRYALRNGVIQ
jgi:DNA-binding NarL/FixJ family response regulator